MWHSTSIDFMVFFAPLERKIYYRHIQMKSEYLYATLQSREKDSQKDCIKNFSICQRFAANTESSVDNARGYVGF